MQFEWLFDAFICDSLQLSKCELGLVSVNCIRRDRDEVAHGVLQVLLERCVLQQRNEHYCELQQHLSMCMQHDVEQQQQRFNIQHDFIY